MKVKASTDPSPQEIEGLISDAKIGDREAFGRLYEIYVPQVYRYVASKARRPMVEDFVADTFVKALRSIERFEFRGVDFGAWLISIARNLIYDYAKSHRASKEILRDELPDASDDHTEDEVIALLRAETVRRALTRVPEDHRSVLRLRYFDGRTAKEAGEELARSPGAIRTLQYRALASLKVELDAESELTPA